MVSIPQLPFPLPFLPSLVSIQNLTEFHKFEKDRKPLFYVDMVNTFNKQCSEG